MPRAENFLHAEIQSSLTSRLGCPVAIERVRLHPVFLSLALDNPRIRSSPSPGAPLLFSCRRWTLFLIPVHRTESFPWFSISVGKSRVEIPVLRLDAVPIVSGGQGGFSWLDLLPAHRLEWSEGSFHLPALKRLPSFTLSESAGSAVFSAGSASAEVRGATPWGSVSIAGGIGVPIFSRDKTPRWKAALTFPSARVEEITPFLPTPPPGEWSGAAEVTVGARADLRERR